MCSGMRSLWHRGNKSRVCNEEGTVQRKRFLKLSVLLLLSLLLPLSALADLEAHFIDVGQGDACIIVCDGEAMMIDGGPRSASSKIYSYIRKTLGLSELKYIVASHPHVDNVGGISGALNAVPVGCIFSPVLEWDTKTFTSMVEYAEAQGTPIVIPSDGDTFSVGGATVTVLLCWPEAQQTNDTSIIMRVEYNGFSILFTGDAGYTAEYMVIDSGYPLDSDVLKVAFHGSKTSSTPEFISAVDPQIAIISCKKDNCYGHPDPETLETLSECSVYRTDQDGTIKIVIGDSLEVETEKRR